MFKYPAKDVYFYPSISHPPKSFIDKIPKLPALSTKNCFRLVNIRLAKKNVLIVYLITYFLQENCHRLTLAMSANENFKPKLEEAEKNLLESKVSKLNDDTKKTIYDQVLDSLFSYRHRRCQIYFLRHFKLFCSCKILRYPQILLVIKLLYTCYKLPKSFTGSKACGSSKV